MKIFDINKKEIETNCIACDIQNGKILLPIARIYESKYFVVEQDLEYPIEGFLIIASKKHLYSIEEMSTEEYNDYCDIILKSRIYLKKMGIEKITFVQEENTKNSHFHTWIFPWHDWMYENFGYKVDKIKLIMDFAKENNSTPEYTEKINIFSSKIANLFKNL